MRRKAADGEMMTMADPDKVPEGMEPDSREYWKYRARQWQKRCSRSEHDLTRLIAERDALRSENARIKQGKRYAALAVTMGDVQPTSRDYAPRRL